METTVKFLRNLLTGPSGRHYELGRVGLAVCLLAVIGYQGWSIQVGGTFEPVSFAGGLAALLFGGGAGIAQKDRARPASLVDGEEIV